MNAPSSPSPTKPASSSSRSVLAAHDVEILSTGGTAKHLADAGIAVTPIAQWSGAPEILGGRVKTLTPKVFGAILHDRGNADHVADVERLAIPPIDLVVVNLYPFETTIAKEGVTHRRSDRADRHRRPVDAARRGEEPSARPPALRPVALRRLHRANSSAARSATPSACRAAVAVFEKTSAYDATIATFLGNSATGNPATSRSRSSKFQDLRYGENPQQSASFYVPTARARSSSSRGKSSPTTTSSTSTPPSASQTRFDEPAIAIIKHTNPCGVARRDSLDDALRAAIESDPVSAFGGIIGANREFDGACAQRIADMFLEVIVAPSFSEEARDVLAKKKNLRLVTTTAALPDLEFRSAAGGILAQQPDRVSDATAWRVVTERQPSPERDRTASSSPGSSARM